MMTGRSLDRIFEPASVAVVGASENPRKRGHQVVKAILEGGFDGHLYPVNPRGGTLLGRPMVSSLKELPEAPDVVVISTPASTVPALLEEAAEQEAGGAVVLAAGFRETGAKGAELEGRVRSIAREGGLRVVGPNCSGFLNPGRGLDLIGLPEAPVGRIGLVSQSGNAVLALVNEAAETKGEGFSLCVGVGNEADVSFHEYLAYLGDHPGTDVIMVYAEGFGDGRAFVDAASRVTRSKPVVLLRGGRSAAGEDAARSHTGAVMTPHQTVRAALREAGVVEITRSDELLPVARALVSLTRSVEKEVQISSGGTPGADGTTDGSEVDGTAIAAPRHKGTGEGIAILADGGGQATVAADTLSELGIPLADIGLKTRSRLREILGDVAVVENPVDVAGACDQAPHRFGDALEALMADPGVSTVLMVGLFGGYHVRFAEELEEEEVETAERMASLCSEWGKPLVIHSIYSGRGARPLLRIREAGVSVMDSLEVACRATGAQWDAGTRMMIEAPDPGAPKSVVSDSQGPPRPASGQAITYSVLDIRHKGEGVLKGAWAAGRLQLLEPEARELVEPYGVSMAPARLCGSDTEIRACAEAHEGERLCVKMVSDTITHKSDAGGVVLGVKGPEGAVRAANQIRESASRYASEEDIDPSIRGFLVGPALSSPVAEMLVGMRRDNSFGPVVTLGAGGTAVEVHRDVTVRLLPVTRVAVLDMLRELRVSRVLQGHRGRPGADLEAFADLVLALAHCFLDQPLLEVLEANPVFAEEDDAVAVDLRAALASERLAEGEGAPHAVCARG